MQRSIVLCVNSPMLSECQEAIDIPQTGIPPCRDRTTFVSLFECDRIRRAAYGRLKCQGTFGAGFRQSTLHS